MAVAGQLAARRPILIKSDGCQGMCNSVKLAMADAGAGSIGQYTHCSFRTPGIGSFVPLPAAQPYVGSAGKLEEVQEYRLEMVCAASWAGDVIAAMIEKHPYDEVAYDVYELANEPVKYGYGRVARLIEQLSCGSSPMW